MLSIREYLLKSLSSGNKVKYRYLAAHDGILDNGIYGEPIIEEVE